MNSAEKPKRWTKCPSCDSRNPDSPSQFSCVWGFHNDKRVEADDAPSVAAPREDDRKVVWLVEAFHEDKSDGFWVGPRKGEGGWRTQNAWAAKQYTKAEAEAVAAALDYFPSPFRWSHWVATEHVFIGKDYSHPVAASSPVAPPQPREACQFHIHHGGYEEKCMNCQTMTGVTCWELCPKCGQPVAIFTANGWCSNCKQGVWPKSTLRASLSASQREPQPINMEAERKRIGDYLLSKGRTMPDDDYAMFEAGWLACLLESASQREGQEAPQDVMGLLREIDKWCSGENQVDDGEDAEDALRYIQGAIKAWLASPSLRRALDEGICDTTDWPHLMSDGSGKQRLHEKRDSCTNWRVK